MNLPDEEAWVEKMPGLCGFCGGPPGKALATGTAAAEAVADGKGLVRVFPL